MNTKIASSLTFGATVSVAAVIGTFLVALISNQSRRLPGIVEIQIVETSDEASVGVSWGAGIAVLFIVSSALAYLVSTRASRSEP